jgi:NitT/TauT family transport system permease protein
MSQEKTPTRSRKTRPTPSSLGSSLGQVIRRIAGVALLVASWQFVTVVFQIPPYILPQPVALAQGIVENWKILSRELQILLVEAVGGFIAGNAIGILLAILVDQSRTLRTALLPLALTIRSVPIVAITPLITLIIGFGYGTSVTVAAIICFFPTFVNVGRGLQSVQAQALQMFRLLDCNRWNTFWKLRFPYSLPFLFAALRVTGPSAIIGAMVAEFIASNAGMGYYIQQSYTQYRYDAMWQAIILTTLSSLTVFTLVALVERLVIPWYHAHS